MSGIYNSCTVKFQKSYPHAIYAHCAMYFLNLTLSHSCTTPEVRNCLRTINKLIIFFIFSCKREKVVKDKILHVVSHSKGTRLITFYETRWLEKLDSTALFYEIRLLLLYITVFVELKVSLKCYD